MPRFSSLFLLLVCGGLLFACQGDQGIPSEPDRGLDLTAGACRDAGFASAATIYVSSSVRNAKLQACKDIQALFKRGKIQQAELKVDDLLVAIHNDYQNGTAALAAVASQTLEQSVASYIGEACGLGPLSPSECLEPKDLDETPDGIDADDLDGWIAAGPLTGSATALATGVLSNGLFGFGVEGGPAYVIVSERRRTGVDGPCPENFPNDCQDDVFDVDVDGTFTSVSVESCAVFGERHARCPEGRDCSFGETTTALGLVTDDVCLAAGYTLMGFWGQFAFQATRPVQWMIHATPAYAAGVTKFTALSPIVLADGDPRTRGVDCRVVNSQFSAGSEGSICRLLTGGTQISECSTVQDGTHSSSCTLTPAIPTDITVLVTVEKTGGGVYQAESAPFGMGPANPARGEANKQTCFELNPPDAVHEVSCP